MTSMSVAAVWTQPAAESRRPRPAALASMPYAAAWCAPSARPSTNATLIGKATVAFHVWPRRPREHST